jgi:hypothetical protein
VEEVEADQRAAEMEEGLMHRGEALGTGGRPPLRLRRCFGNSGSTTAHSSSETNTLMPGCYTAPAWRF